MGISVAVHGSLGLQRTMAYATWVFSKEPTMNVQQKLIILRVVFQLTWPGVD